jgi:hypothetical protein
MKTFFFTSFVKMSILVSPVLLFTVAGCSSGEHIIPADYTDRQSGFGAQVIVETIDGNEYTGELLSVRDSVIFVCDKYGASETGLAKGIYAIHRIANSRITLIAVKGKKTYITGMLTGGAVGAAMGAGIGALTGEESTEGNHGILKFSQGQCIAGGACLLGLAGVAVGGLIGAAGSSEDTFIYDSAEPSQIDYEFLKRFARYPEEEPDYIPALRNNL